MMQCDVVLRWVVSEAFEAGVPLYIKISPFDLVAAVEVSHLHQARAVFLDGLIRDAHRCCVIAMDGSGRLRMSISASVSCNTRPSFMFKNNAPNSASAADDATNLRTVHMVYIALFRRIG